MKNTFSISTDIDLKVAAKFFGSKFACGSSVTGDDEIVIQGDVKDDLFEVIPEKWPQVSYRFKRRKKKVRKLNSFSMENLAFFFPDRRRFYRRSWGSKEIIRLSTITRAHEFNYTLFPVVFRINKMYIRKIYLKISYFLRSKRFLIRSLVLRSAPLPAPLRRAEARFPLLPPSVVPRSLPPSVCKTYFKTDYLLWNLEIRIFLVP